MEINENLSDKAKYDLTLVEAAKKGSQAAYAELMDRYHESVYYTMSKMVKDSVDAEDLTIEAFGKAFSRLDQYSPTFAFSTWLFKIASNNCIDFIRKKRIKMSSIDTGHTTNSGETIYFDTKSQSQTPEEAIIHLQKVKLMRNLVDKLKPRYKELVELRYFEEMSYEEIAETLNLPLGTVKAQLFRARDYLAILIENTKESI